MDELVLSPGERHQPGFVRTRPRTRRATRTPTSDSGERLPTLAAGGAIQMAAGYEGKGKGAPSGGAHILYDIYSEHLGRFNSKSMVLLQWRHVIGMEGSCLY